MNSISPTVRLRLLVAIGAAAAALLGGCAMVVEQTTIAFSSYVQAIGVVDGRVVHGQAIFPDARAATLQLDSSDTPVLSCSGALRYTATRSGVISLACNDGRSASVVFQSLSVLSGYGRGAMDPAEVLLTYGLPPEKAAGYLGLPAERLQPPAPSPAASGAKGSAP